MKKVSKKINQSRRKYSKRKYNKSTKRKYSKRKYSKRKYFSKKKRKTLIKKRYKQKGGENITSISVSGPYNRGEYKDYVINIISSVRGEISIRKRYSEFEAFDSRLKSQFNDVSVELPSKLFFHNKGNLEARRDGLQSYLNGIKEVIEVILDSGEGPLYDFFIESGQLDSSLEIPESGGYLSPAASSVSSISPDLKSKGKGDISPLNLRKGPPRIVYDILAADDGSLDNNCQLCFKNSNPVPFSELEFGSNFHDRSGTYIWVVKVSEPNKIVYLNEYKEDGKLAEQVYQCSTKEPRARNHSCIANNEPILCGGDFIVNKESKTIEIRNKSGHYQPKFECINEDIKSIYESVFVGYEIIYTQVKGEDQFGNLFDEDY